MEYVFRRPAFMTTCIYAVYGIFMVSVLHRPVVRIRDLGPDYT